jgi:hypothetical protein
VPKSPGLLLYATMNGNNLSSAAKRLHRVALCIGLTTGTAAAIRCRQQSGFREILQETFLQRPGNRESDKIHMNIT